jgi:hypothetical protein
MAQYLRLSSGFWILDSPHAFTIETPLFNGLTAIVFGVYPKDSLGFAIDSTTPSQLRSVSVPVRAVSFHALLRLALEFAARLVSRRRELAIGALVVQKATEHINFFLGDQ